MDLQGILYEEPTIWLFLLVTVVMGGAAAWASGKACAQTWRPYTTLVFYLFLLSLAVRFAHFALFQGTLISVHYLAVDFVVVQIIGALGFRYTRAAQMVGRYGWRFAANGPFGWRDQVARDGGERM